MSGVGILGAIIIGILAGWIAEQVMKRDHGLFMNLIVGLAGALLGAFVAGALGIEFAGFVGSLIVSTLGAILLLFIFGLVRRRRA
ncbi:MAG: GlsB/YeaQ/YmgE family stress response membrane protein [Phenylobacterium sp.]|uniref:GlsB/YeaQ/YmgE family stress response membrane protein n=1 Tax=Phenylobacterium sp. TaxID=1871053 RepID=UPI00391B86A2